MKNTLVGIALCLLGTGVVGAEVTEERQALIEQVLEMHGSNYVGEKYAMSLVDNVRRSFSEAGIEVDEIFFDTLLNVSSEVVYEEFVLTGELEDILSKVWGDFDTSELRELVEFYKTPTGKKLLRVLPESVMGGVSFEQRVGLAIEKQLIERLLEAGIDMESLYENNASTQRLISQGELSKLEEEICSTSDDSGKARPFYRGAPNYPYMARQYSVEGWVELSFSVKADGNTSDVRVTGSSTGALFDAAAIDAVRNYKYCPGKGVDSSSAVRIRFEMKGN